MMDEIKPLREKIAGAQLSPDGDGFAGCVGYPATDAALAALGIPLPVLAWCAANPEAAKGLAEGGLVAVPRVLNSAHVRAYFGRHSSEFSPGLHGQWDDLLQVVAASTPAPSGKAQSIPFGSDDPNAPDGVF